MPQPQRHEIGTQHFQAKNKWLSTTNWFQTWISFIVAFRHPRHSWADTCACCGRRGKGKRLYVTYESFEWTIRDKPKKLHLISDRDREQHPYTELPKIAHTSLRNEFQPKECEITATIIQINSCVAVRNSIGWCPLSTTVTKILVSHKSTAKRMKNHKNTHDTIHKTSIELLWTLPSSKQLMSEQFVVFLWLINRRRSVWTIFGLTDTVFDIYLI